MIAARRYWDRLTGGRRRRTRRDRSRGESISIWSLNPSVERLEDRRLLAVTDLFVNAAVNALVTTPGGLLTVTLNLGTTGPGIGAPGATITTNVSDNTLIPDGQVSLGGSHAPFYSCSATGGQVTCVGNAPLVPGAVHQISFTLGPIPQPLVGTTLSFITSITAALADFDPFPANNSTAYGADVRWLNNWSLDVSTTDANVGSPYDIIVVASNGGPHNSSPGLLAEFDLFHDQTVNNGNTGSVPVQGQDAEIVECTASYDGPNQVLSCEVPESVDSGDTVEFAVAVDPPPPSAANMTAVTTYECTPAPNGYDSDGCSGTVETFIKRSADLSITKTDNATEADPITVGETVTYTITVHNAGPNDESVVEVSDLWTSGLPDRFTVNNGESGPLNLGGDNGEDWTCEFSTGGFVEGISCTLTDTPLAVGETSEFTFTTDPLQNSLAYVEIINDASVNVGLFNAFDRDLSNNISTVTTEVLASTDFEISMEVLSAVAGVPGIFEGTVINHGPSDANPGVTVEWTFSPNVTFSAGVFWTGNDWSCSWDGFQTVSCEALNEFANGSAIPLELQSNPYNPSDAGSVVTATAHVTTTDGAVDPNEINDSDTVQGVVQPEADANTPPVATLLVTDVRETTGGGGQVTVVLTDVFDPNLGDLHRFSFATDPSQLAETFSAASDVAQDTLDFAQNTNSTIHARVLDNHDAENTYTINVIVGNNSSEVLTGTDEADIIIGLGGHDVIDAGAGDDYVLAGAGNDIVNLGDGDDTAVYRGDGNGFDELFEGPGFDRVVSLGTVIGLNGYNNGVESFEGSGHTIIRDVNSSRTLDFSNTELTGIQEIDAGGGNDSIITSDISPAIYRGGAGNDKIHTGAKDATLLYDGTNNGFDQFLTNGTGTATAIAESAGTVIGVDGYDNGVDTFEGTADTIIRDVNSSRTLDFSTTELVDIQEVDAAGGNDTITTSDMNSVDYRGGKGNDKFHTGTHDVNLLYDGTNNGFDKFLTNGTGTAVAIAESAGTVIGVDGYDNGVDTFEGTADTIIRDVNSSRTLDFSTTELVDIQEVDAAGGNDTITTSDMNSVDYRGGKGNDKFHTGIQDVNLLYDGTNNGFDKFLTNGAGTAVAIGESAGTVIGIDGYDNGIEKFDGLGGTIIRDVNSSRTLNFANTELSDIGEVDAAGGNDTVTASDISPADYRGGTGNDTFHTGTQGVNLLYDGTNNGFDKFVTNGTGTAVAIAESAGTVIGIDGYDNGIEKFDGLGGTIIRDVNSSRTLNFANTELSDIGEVDAAGGNDTVTASDISPADYRGGNGNDKFHTGIQDVNLLYDGTNNGFDKFLTNGTGTAVAIAESAGTVIGIDGYDNGVETFQGTGDTIIRDVNSSRTVDFSDTELVDIAEIDAAGGNDTITASNLAAAHYRGGSGNDVFRVTDDTVAHEVAILDFGVGADKLNLIALAISFNQLQLSSELPGEGDPLIEDTLIALPGGRQIRLVDFALAELAEEDFVF